MTISPSCVTSKDRVYVPLEGMEELVKPCFVYLKSNENPALAAFADFLAEERSRN